MKRLTKIFLAFLVVATSISCFACKDKGKESEKVVAIKAVTNVNNGDDINLYYGVTGLDKYALNFVFDPAEASYKDLNVSITGDAVVDYSDGELVSKQGDGTAIVSFTAKKGTFSAEFVVNVINSTAHPELLLLNVDGEKGKVNTFNWNLTSNDTLNIETLRPNVLEAGTLMFEFKPEVVEHLNICNKDGSSRLSLEDSSATDGYSKKLVLSENGCGIKINNVDALSNDFTFSIKISYIYYTGENASLNQSIILNVNVIK